MNPPKILADSEHWLVVDKPSGMVVHRSRGANDRYSLVAVMRAELGPEVYPVNRLDRQTSGVIVMARSKDAARELSAAFAERRVGKVYEAVVRGWPPLEPGESLTIERELSGRAALTRVEVLAKTELQVSLGRYPTTRLARLRLQPATGVTHQLRRHLKGWGYPIINDSRHGDTQLNPKFLAAYGIKRLLLHSHQLSFPFADQLYSVEAPWTGRLLGLLDFLGLTEAWPQRPPEEREAPGSHLA